MRKEEKKKEERERERGKRKETEKNVAPALHSWRSDSEI